MDSVEEVVIDGDGVFKYILIELTEKKKGGAEKPRTKLIVRGFEWAEFHGVFAIQKLDIVMCIRPVQVDSLFHWPQRSVQEGGSLFLTLKPH